MDNEKPKYKLITPKNLTYDVNDTWNQSWPGKYHLLYKGIVFELFQLGYLSKIDNTYNTNLVLRYHDIVYSALELAEFDRLITEFRTNNISVSDGWWECLLLKGLIDLFHITQAEREYSQETYQYIGSDKKTYTTSESKVNCKWIIYISDLIKQYFLKELPEQQKNLY